MSNKEVTGQPLGPHDALGAIGLGTSIGDVVALAVEADDEHRASVAVATGLAWRKNRRFVVLGCDVAHALSESAVAESVGAAEEVDGVVGVVGSEGKLHGAVMLVAEGQDVRPHE